MQRHVLALGYFFLAVAYAFLAALCDYLSVRWVRSTYVIYDFVHSSR